MSIESMLHRLEVLDQRVALLQQERNESLISLISEIQKEKKVESLEFSPRTGFPEYYSNYSQNTSLVLAVKVQGQSILVRVNDGNGNDFFDPNQDGEIVQDLTPYLSKYIRKPLYRLGIIDHNVSIPEDIDKEYDSIDEAYEALSTFVHSFDGVMQVDGRVLDENDEDVEYSSSLFEERRGQCTITEKDLRQKWGWPLVDRTALTEEEERQFVADYTSFAESNQQREVFLTDAKSLTAKDGKTRLKKYAGKPFEILGTCSENETDPYWKTDLECLPMWKIRFQDGQEAKAYAEEIFRI